MTLFTQTLAEHLGTCQSLPIRTVCNTYHVHVIHVPVQSNLIFNFLEVKKITLKEFLKITHFIYSQIKWNKIHFFYTYYTQGKWNCTFIKTYWDMTYLGNLVQTSKLKKTTSWYLFKKLIAPDIKMSLNDYWFLLQWDWIHEIDIQTEILHWSGIT